MKIDIEFFKKCAASFIGMFFTVTALLIVETKLSQKMGQITEEAFHAMFKLLILFAFLGIFSMFILSILFGYIEKSKKEER